MAAFGKSGGFEMIDLGLPAEIEFRDQSPKTMVGKMLRRVLVEEELKRIQEQD